MIKTKRTYDPQLRTIADECTLRFSVLRHFYVCYMHIVKDGFHTAGRGIWIIDVFMLSRMCCVLKQDWIGEI